MDDDTTRQSVLFSDLFDQPLLAKFDQPHGSSDGGAVLLKAADARLQLSQRLAACLDDERQAGKVSHGIQEIFRQRLFAIACGYPDGNDCGRSFPGRVSRCASMAALPAPRCLITWKTRNSITSWRWRKTRY